MSAKASSNGDSTSGDAIYSALARAALEALAQEDGPVLEYNSEDLLRIERALIDSLQAWKDPTGHGTDHGALDNGTPTSADDVVAKGTSAPSTVPSSVDRGDALHTAASPGEEGRPRRTRQSLGAELRQRRASASPSSPFSSPVMRVMEGVKAKAEDVVAASLDRPPHLRGQGCTAADRAAPPSADDCAAKNKATPCHPSHPSLVSPRRIEGGAARGTAEAVFGTSARWPAPSSRMGRGLLPRAAASSDSRTAVAPTTGHAADRMSGASHPHQSASSDSHGTRSISKLLAGVPMDASARAELVERCAAAGLCESSLTQLLDAGLKAEADSALREAGIGRLGHRVRILHVFEPKLCCQPFPTPCPSHT